MSSQIRGILLDIEGTTSSISFVYDVMFPYVRENLADYLNGNWDASEVQECLPLLAADLGQESKQAWFGDADNEGAKQLVHDGVISLMDADVKATGLKQLQGLVWKDGFHSGQMVAHLYDDVAPAIESWRDAGIDIRIYSSGSIAAQKLFFGHTICGDLLESFGNHYDTTTGPKKEADSYRRITGDFGIEAGSILFVSDVPAELEAARESGMQTVLSVRPGNKPVDPGHGFVVVESFADIAV
ncbi:MAG: acireductone synthase [Planctomycetota bacterium]